MKVQLQWHILMLSSLIFKVHRHTKSMIHTIQGVPKVRSSKFMHHDFWSKPYFYMKLLDDVYFSVEYTYSPGAQELVQPPNQYLFSLGSWKK